MHCGPKCATTDATCPNPAGTPVCFRGTAFVLGIIISKFSHHRTYHHLPYSHSFHHNLSINHIHSRGALAGRTLFEAWTCRLGKPDSVDIGSPPA
ncbi:hypothetical protein JAAARDRAFT_438382 [Jaapia argillacea MUCL 33604]|uniref:Uncharacterized protein n=1 Tax=Jaapia argillacea MUCL 33604 TaxID=933084 RepID=A0A067PPK1_9AGAM|nr:hypothetical protein JAAARDRAFT_438382 [Jaapia argillacea MUCL 33604]